MFSFRKNISLFCFLDFQKHHHWNNMHTILSVLLGQIKIRNFLNRGSPTTSPWLIWNQATEVVGKHVWCCTCESGTCMWNHPLSPCIHRIRQSPKEERLETTVLNKWPQICVDPYDPTFQDYLPCATVSKEVKWGDWCYVYLGVIFLLCRVSPQNKSPQCNYAS